MNVKECFFIKIDFNFIWYLISMIMSACTDFVEEQIKGSELDIGYSYPGKSFD